MQTRMNTLHSKKSFWKSWKLWSLIAVVLFVVSGISSCVNEYKKETAPPSTKIYKLDSDASVNAMLKHYVPDIKISQVSGSYAISGGKTVAVTIKQNGDYVDDKQIVSTAARDLLQTWNAFKKSKATDFQNISIMITHPTSTSKIPVVKTTITGKKLKTFDKQTSSNKDVPSIASTYWQRNDLPSLK